MGIYDRDYYREDSRQSFGSFIAGWSATNWLIAINVAIFVLDGVLQRLNSDGYKPLQYWGYFSVSRAIFHLQLWRFITFQFLHESPSHILFNMIGLFFFGRICEDYLGSWRFLALYLLSGFGGALGLILLSATHVIQEGNYTMLVGASAGIFGVLMGAVVIAPNLPILLFLMPFPIRLQVLVYIYIGIAVYTVLTAGDNAGGQAAHLGGAAVGYLLMKNQHLLNFAERKSRLRYGGRRVRMKNWRDDYDR